MSVLRRSAIAACLVAACMVVSTAGLGAQSTTGTISGRLTDAQGLALPGVTVTATSPNLQGPRETVTSENGDYILSLLPPGPYTVAFSLTGFEQQRRTVTVAPTQTVPVDAQLGVAGLTDTVLVVGNAADVLTRTAQVATNFSGQLIADLPTNRDINTALHLAPSVHATGPAGQFSIAGSMSFENLFLINGVTVNENLRGQARPTLVIEDAIQETTVSSAGISAEYGRFGGGVMNVITKAGGNQFTGSFRDTLANDDWRALVPKREGDTFANDTKLDKVVPTYEYTAGGPILRDRLWFFTAGRLQKQESNRQLVVTNTPYVFTNNTERYETKLTYSPWSGHRVQGAYNKLIDEQLNFTFNQSQSMDLNSLTDRKVPEDLFALNYTGAYSSNFYLEALYSQRNLTFMGDGAKFTDRLKGTLLVEPSGRRYWSATFCGVCTPEERDNQNVFVKGTYFASTDRAGSHSVTVGYDFFDDIRKANNHQSGSGYRITNAPAILRDGVLYPQFATTFSTRIQWNPIFLESQGSDFRTHSAFVNDSWRIGNLTANIGVRFEKNDGVDQAGKLVATNSSWSPRLGLVWDPTGAGTWAVSASASKYVAGLLNGLADASSPAGSSDTYLFAYTGPPINADANGPLVDSEEALARLFTWFDAAGGANLPLVGTPTVRGVTPQILGSLRPPSNWEYSTGVSRQLGSRATARADVVYRRFQDFYIQRTDLTTGRATDTRSFAPITVQGRQYDLSVLENDESGDLKRQYAGLTFQGTYRVTDRTQIGGNYTLSRTWGNVDGESPNTAAGYDARFVYPEYKQASWNFPDGNLLVDQRHRARLWLNFGVPRVDGLSLNLLQLIESGVPYSASNQNAANFSGVDAARYVANPGYLNPPTATQIQYYFTARDAFRTEGQKRTDLAINYDYRLGVGGARRLNVFIQAQIVNLFNQFQMCGCGASVFLNGGNVQNQFIGTSVQTAVTNAALFQSFNPFTETPVRGVHWDYGTDFGKAVNRFAYTTPRMLRLTFGVRF
jgi:outer membrane receptor for ferrienterochelin and colicin